MFTPKSTFTTHALTGIAKLLFLMPLLFLFSQPAMAAEKDKVKGPNLYIIPVSGPVEPGLAAYVRRALEDIKDKPDAKIVFKLDTFGGRVDSAFEIVEAISEIPPERTAAYVEKRAISAGALIALSAGALVMKESTLIGDCAPIIQTNDGQKEAGEKIQTVLRAQFRTLAKRNNYPEVLAEAMVTKNMEVYRIVLDGETRYLDKTDFEDLSEEKKALVTEKKTIVAEGELLTMDDREARDLGFSRKSVTDLDEALAALGMDMLSRIEIEESWSEGLVRALQPFLPILMLIGIGAIYMEIKAPGFGLPGMLGILCLSLVFFNQYLVGLADYTELLIFMVGFLLLGVEVFVLPGFGIAGISAIIVIAMGLVLSFQDFVLPDPAMPWEGRLMLKNFGMVMGSALGALLMSALLIRYVLPGLSRSGRGPYLTATLQDSHADSKEVLGVTPGQTGTALTQLRPSGKIRIEKKKIDAITQGDFISSGSDVRVVSVEQNRVVVEMMETYNGEKG